MSRTPFKINIKEFQVNYKINSYQMSDAVKCMVAQRPCQYSLSAEKDP